MPEEIRLVVNDELHDRLIELTDGAAALCFQCGTCTASCPWGLVRENHLPVRTIIHQAQLGVPGWQETERLPLAASRGEVQARVAVLLLWTDWSPHLRVAYRLSTWRTAAW
jgi:ferredoxin